MTDGSTQPGTRERAVLITGATADRYGDDSAQRDNAPGQRSPPSRNDRSR